VHVVTTKHAKVTKKREGIMNFLSERRTTMLDSFRAVRKFSLITPDADVSRRGAKAQSSEDLFVYPLRLCAFARVIPSSVAAQPHWVLRGEIGFSSC
jgi:hypothetical protein